MSVRAACVTRALTTVRPVQVNRRVVGGTGLILVGNLLVVLYSSRDSPHYSINQLRHLYMKVTFVFRHKSALTRSAAALRADPVCDLSGVHLLSGACAVVLVPAAEAEPGRGHGAQVGDAAAAHLRFL